MVVIDRTLEYVNVISHSLAPVFEKFVHPEGVEPPTYSSVGCRSIQLSYGCVNVSYIIESRQKTAGF